MAVKYVIEVDDQGSVKVKEFADNIGKTAPATDRLSKSSDKLDRSWAKTIKTGVALTAVVVGLRKGYRALSGFVQGSIKEGAEAELQQSQLAAAYQNTGEYSAELMERSRELASELQRQTVVGDDTAIGWMALGRAMGVPTEMLGEFVQALAGAEAAGLPAQTMMRGLATSLQGQADMVKRYVPAVRELTEAELRRGDAIRLVRDTYLPLAEAQRTTFSGSAMALKNSYGDLREEMAQIVTAAPITRAAMLELSTELDHQAELVRLLGDDYQTFTETGVHGLITSYEFLIGTQAAVRTGLLQTKHVITSFWETVLGATAAVTGFGAALMQNKLVVGFYADMIGLTAAVGALDDKVSGWHESVGESAGEAADSIAAIDKRTELTMARLELFRLRVMKTADELKAMGEAGAGAMDGIGAGAGAGAGAGGEAGPSEWESVAGGGFGDWLDTIGPSEETLDRLQIIAEIEADRQAKIEQANELYREQALAVQSLVTEWTGAADQVGFYISNMATAEDKTAAAKAAFKGMARTAIDMAKEQMIAAIVAQQTQAAVTSQTGAQQAAALAPAAALQSIITAGGAPAAGAAAFGIAVPIMLGLIGGLISGIADEGLRPGDLPGAGRKTALLYGSEYVISPTGSKDVDVMLRHFRRQTVDAGGFGLDYRGRDQMPVNVHSDIYLDSDRIGSKVARVMARNARGGGGDWTTGGLYNG